jgi:ribosomal protein S18 acetylase RimI-like enzyme
MDKVEIYTPSPEKWEDYRYLRLRATKEDPEGFWPPYETALTLSSQEWRQPIVDAIDDNGRWIFFAKLNGKLVGMISAKAMEKLDGGVKMRDMFVAKEARGKGIGKQLLSKLLITLRGNIKVKVVRLGVFTTQEAAIKMYQSLGFVILSQELEHFPDGLTHESFIMEKKLV